MKQPEARIFEHAAWVRQLAHSLLSDPAAADDVVQETWMAALRNPPDQERPVRPWLARVVRNFAIARHRRETGRRVREEHAARPDELPSTDRLLERLETQRLVDEAVRELDEPVRTTILWRYHENLSSAEIARRTGAQPSTVRSRLKRGLEELRTKLDSTAGGRDAWVVALTDLLPRGTPLVPAPGPSTPTSTGTGAGIEAATVGALTMNLTKIAAVLTATSFGLWVLIARQDAASAETVAPATVEATPALPATIAHANPATTAGDARRELESSVEPRADVTEPAVSLATVVGRVVDVRGLDLMGSDLTLFADGGALPEHATRLNSSGFEFSIELEDPDAMLVFRASHPQYATRFVSAHVEAGATTHLGAITLELAGSVSGRVLDEEGRPVAGARVTAAPPELDRSPQAAERRGPSIDIERSPRATTDANGHYQLERVSPGSHRVWAQGDASRWAFSTPLHVEAERATTGIDLELRALVDRDRIAGQVVGPDGTPLPGVNVSGSWTGAASGGGTNVTTDEEGRFEFRLKERTPHEISAGDPQSRWPRIPGRRVQPGTEDLVLRFRTPDDAFVQVTSSSGEPVDGFRVLLYSSGTGNWLSGSGLVSPKDGRHALAAPEEPFRIEVEADHHAVASVGPFDPRNLPQVIDVQLELLPGLRGRVLDDGVPIANAQVALHQQNWEGMLIVSNGFRTRINPHPESSARTDAEGRFHLTAREEGGASIFVEAEGHVLNEYSLNVDPQRGHTGIEIELMAGGAIEGQVLTVGGGSPAGVIVGISRGDGRARTQRVGPDGSFLFNGLTPGPWQVVRTDQEIDPEQVNTSYSSRAGLEPIRWDCEVYAGDTTHQDVDLRGQECTLSGRFTINGVVDPGWSVRLSSGSASQTFDPSSTALDGNGRFTLESTRAGQFDLVLERELANGRASYKSIVDLEPGTSTWDLDLEVGRLSGEGLAPSGETELELIYAFEDHRGEFTAQFEAEELGAFELSIAPVGQGKFYRYDGALSVQDRSPWELVAQPTIARAETTVVSP